MIVFPDNSIYEVTGDGTPSDGIWFADIHQELALMMQEEDSGQHLDSHLMPKLVNLHT
jgi:hypothetical protein